MDRSTFLIRVNTQLTVGSLRVGVGNIREAAYTDEQNVNRQGLTAGLWLYVRDDPSKNQQIRVHIDQEVTISNYLVRVEDISRSKDGAFVQLTVISKDELGGFELDRRRF